MNPIEQALAPEIEALRAHPDKMHAIGEQLDLLYAFARAVAANRHPLPSGHTRQPSRQQIVETAIRVCEVIDLPGDWSSVRRDIYERSPR